jgi:hypothetical protein
VSSPAGSSAPTSTALTGSTTHLWMIALIGSLLLLGGMSLLYAEAPRLLHRRTVPASGLSLRTAPASSRLGRWSRRAPERGPNAASMQPGRSGAPPGLWVRGWEPEAAPGTETFWVL